MRLKNLNLVQKKNFQIIFTLSKQIITTAKYTNVSSTENYTGWYNFSNKINKALMRKRSEILYFLRQKNIPAEEGKKLAK